MTRSRWVDAFTSRTGTLRWSLGVRIVETSTPKRCGMNARGAQRRLVLKQRVSLCICLYQSTFSRLQNRLVHHKVRPHS